MLIKRIVIKNFRSHAETKIGFKNGVNIILGENGAGKSSILEAIFGALYAGHPSLKNWEANKTRVGSSNYELELDFEYNGRDYKIVRKGGNQQIFEIVDGFPQPMTPGGKRNVALYTDRLILPMHLFKNAIYVKQGEIDKILSDDDEREKIIKRILEVDKLDDRLTILTKVINYYKNQIKSQAQFIEPLNLKKQSLQCEEKELEGNRKKLEEYREELKKLNNILQQHTERLNKLEFLKSSMQQLTEEINKLESELKIVTNNCNNSKQKITQLEQEIKELEEKKQRKKELIPYVKKYHELSTLLRLESKYNDYTTKVSVLSSEVKQLSEKITEIEKKEGDFKKLKNNEIELIKKINKLEPLVNQLNEYNQLTQQLEKITAKIKPYTIDQIHNELIRIDESKKQIEKLRAEKLNLSKKEAGLLAKLNGVKKEMDELKGKDKCPLCKRDITSEDAEKIKEKFMSEIKELENKISHIKKEIDKIENQIVALTDAVNKELEFNRLKLYADEITELQKDISKIPIQDLQGVDEEYKQLNQQLSEVRGQIKQLIPILNEKNNLLSHLQNKNNELNDLNEKISVIAKKLNEKGVSNFESIKKEKEELESYYVEYMGLVKVDDELTNKKEILKTELSELEKYEELINELNSQLLTKRELLSEQSAQFNGDEYTQLNNKLLQVNNSIATINGEIIGLNNLIKKSEKTIQLLNDEVKKLENLAERLEKMEKLIALLDDLKINLTKYKSEIIRIGMEDVEEICSELYSQFTKGKYTVKIESEEGRKGLERVKIKIIHNGLTHSLDYLSGGERILLGLCFRLALALHRVENMSLLILDEPTPFLDEERRRELVVVIERFLKTLPQVILISHDDEFKECGDNVILLENKGGLSKLVKES